MPTGMSLPSLRSATSRGYCRASHANKRVLPGRHGAIRLERQLPLTVRKMVEGSTARLLRFWHSDEYKGNPAKAL